MAEYVLTTSRLGLRTWLESDLAPYAAMNQDAEVMRFFPRTFNLEETRRGLDMYNEHFDQYGFTYYAVDELAEAQFIGFIGIKWQRFENPHTPFVDIGWRLVREAWGRGLATEGAMACMEQGFQEFKLPEIYSTAPALNSPSIHVMKKIGMSFLEPFEHPRIPEGSPLKTCHLYVKKLGEG